MDAFIALVTAGNIFWKKRKEKKKQTLRAFLETYSVYAILEGTLEMEWLGPVF